jgi:4-carboxymuconolactone decarboxylase
MRIDPITPGTRPELAALEAQIVSARGRVSPLYQVLLNSPALAQGWEQMLSAVRNHSSLAADLREICILRVAVLNRADYEFKAHEPIALSAGLTPAQTKDLQNEAIAADKGIGMLFTPVQQLVIALTDVMTRDIEVPDALYAQLKLHFNPQTQVDLVATIAAYNMVSRLLTALHIGH